MTHEDTARALLRRASRELADAEAQLLRASTVSRRLRVDVATVRRWIVAKKIIAITLPGGYYRIPASEVDRIQATLDK